MVSLRPQSTKYIFESHRRWCKQVGLEKLFISEQWDILIWRQVIHIYWPVVNLWIFLVNLQWEARMFEADLQFIFPYHIHISASSVTLVGVKLQPACVCWFVWTWNHWIIIELDLTTVQWGPDTREAAICCERLRGYARLSLKLRD